MALFKSGQLEPLIVFKGDQKGTVNLTSDSLWHYQIQEQHLILEGVKVTDDSATVYQGLRTQFEEIRQARQRNAQNLWDYQLNRIKATEEDKLAWELEAKLLLNHYNERKNKTNFQYTETKTTTKFILKPDQPQFIPGLKILLTWCSAVDLDIQTKTKPQNAPLDLHRDFRQDHQKQIYLGLSYKGMWNANTNEPVLGSGQGERNIYYVVAREGRTELDGCAEWKVGDWIIFDGLEWLKVENNDFQLGRVYDLAKVNFTT